jgi:hypothetical protein
LLFDDATNERVTSGQSFFAFGNVGGRTLRMALPDLMTGPPSAEAAAARRQLQAVRRWLDVLLSSSNMHRMWAQ